MAQQEQEARKHIDGLLEQAGWAVFDATAANIHASRGVAIREFPLAFGHGFTDYPLYVDGKAAGYIEAKNEGVSITGVEVESDKMSNWSLTLRSPGHVSVIDARKLGSVIVCSHRYLTDEGSARITDTYHVWCGEKEAGEYADVPGFCKSAALDEEAASRPRHAAQGESRRLSV